MRRILLHGWFRRNFTKDCVDTSVQVVGIKNSVVQKTKRLTFGATFVVSLVEGKKLRLTDFNLFEFQSFLLKKVESAMNPI